MPIHNPTVSTPGQEVRVKTADEIVNNSDVLQNDDHLAMPVEANEVAWVILCLEALSPSLANLKIAFTIPAAATLVESFDSFHAFGAEADGTQVFSISSMAATAKGWFSRWLYRGGANPGTLQLQWAQNIATAENTTVKAGSYLIKLKVSL